MVGLPFSYLMLYYVPPFGLLFFVMLQNLVTKLIFHPKKPREIEFHKNVYEIIT